MLPLSQHTAEILRTGTFVGISAELPSVAAHNALHECGHRLQTARGGNRETNVRGGGWKRQIHRHCGNPSACDMTGIAEHVDNVAGSKRRYTYYSTSSLR